MNKKDLLEKGYFAKELPPPFNTKLFAEHLDEIRQRWEAVKSEVRKSPKPEKELLKSRFWESKWAVYSIPEVGFSRRLLGIPNIGFPSDQILPWSTKTGPLKFLFRGLCLNFICI